MSKRTEDGNGNQSSESSSLELSPLASTNDIPELIVDTKPQQRKLDVELKTKKCSPQILNESGKFGQAFTLLGTSLIVVAYLLAMGFCGFFEESKFFPLSGDLDSKSVAISVLLLIGLPTWFWSVILWSCCGVRWIDELTSTERALAIWRIANLGYWLVRLTIFTALLSINSALMSALAWSIELAMFCLLLILLLIGLVGYGVGHALRIPACSNSLV
jgi:hypothetical protein